MKLISGSSNHPLAESIARQLGIDILHSEITRFSNGEKRICIDDDAQGENVVVVQSFSKPVDEHIIELLLITDALERLGARNVNAVIPWFGYSLQDKVFRKGESLSAKVVANQISNAYISRNFLLDVHNASITGFFSEPTHHLTALPLFVEYVKNTFELGDVVVASPDFGGLKRAWRFAEALGTDWVNIEKRRDLQTGDITRMELHGSVTGKTVLVFDDVIVSGGTVIEAAEILKAQGAKSVHFLATHGLFVDQALEQLAHSAIDSIVITNSVAHQSLPDTINLIDCAKLFSEQLQTWM